MFFYLKKNIVDNIVTLQFVDNIGSTNKRIIIFEIIFKNFNKRVLLVRVFFVIFQFRWIQTYNRCINIVTNVFEVITEIVSHWQKFKSEKYE